MPLTPEMIEEYPGIAEAFADWTPETIKNLYDGKPDRADLMVHLNLLDERQEVRGPLPPEDTRVHLSIGQIMNAVCDVASVDTSLLTGKRRNLRVARPRQVAMYLICMLRPDLSLPQIAWHFHKDRTTVVHARDRVRELLWDGDSVVHGLVESSIEALGLFPAAPKPEEPKHTAKERTCLMCQKSFQSSWVGERICRACKGTKLYKYGIEGPA